MSRGLSTAQIIWLLFRFQTLFANKEVVESPLVDKWWEHCWRVFLPSIFHVLAVMNADTNTLAYSGCIKLYWRITYAGNWFIHQNHTYTHPKYIRVIGKADIASIISQYFKEMYSNDMSDNIKQGFICNCSSQVVSALISANRMKDIFHPSFSKPDMIT